MSSPPVLVDPQIQQSNPFPGGSHLVLRLMDGTSLSLQIIKPFRLFTKSQVFLVRPNQPGTVFHLNQSLKYSILVTLMIGSHHLNPTCLLDCAHLRQRLKQHIVDRKLRKENAQMISRWI